MFWRFGGYSSISAIDTRLDKPDVTLEEILDEGELMAELKQNNSKLIDYLREDHILKQLLDYVISPSLIRAREEEEEEEEEEGEREEDADGGDARRGEEDGRAGLSEAGADKEGKGGSADSVAHDKPAGAREDNTTQSPPSGTDARETHDDVAAADLISDSSISDDDDDDDDDDGQDMLQQDDSELDAAEKTRLRYAYIACEILSSSTWTITESLLRNEQSLRDFWRFLARPAPLDSLQSGYFTKVNEALLECKTADMLAFFRSMDGVVQQMLLHVDNPMIMDLLLKIISLERAEGGMGIVQWVQSQDLIPTLLTFLSTEHPFSVQTSAGDFLKAIIAISANAAQNDPTIIGPNALTRQLVSRSCVETLIASMLKGGNPLTVGVGIVIEVIRKNNSDYDPELPIGPGAEPTVNDPIYLGALLQLFARHVPDFMRLVGADTTAINDSGRYEVVPRKQLRSAAGTGVEALGFDRFKTCELMAELLHCSNMGLLNEPGSEEYVRQRDEKRDRLVRAGVIGAWRDGADADADADAEPDAEPHGGDSSAFMYGDTSTDFVIAESDADGAQTPTSESASAPAIEPTNLLDKIDRSMSSLGSSPGSLDGGEAGTSPGPGTGNATATLTSIEKEVEDDDEGFEDVSIMRDELERNTQTGGGHGGPVARVDADLSDLVDEPLTPPGKDASATDAQSETSTEEITDRLASLKLDHDRDHDFDQAETPGPAPTAAEESGSAPASAPVAPASQPVSPATSFQMHSLTLRPQANNADTPANDRDIRGIDLSKYPDSHIQFEEDGRPVIGDYLKIMFVENEVVPTILSFFFRFPWNNFLHNVVFDVIQQVLSGPMDRGFNRALVIDVFRTGDITKSIVAGQQRSDRDQKTRKLRLGYMGHLTLIAEEVIKFTERHDSESLGHEILEKVVDPDWMYFVENTLTDTRERDNAILGGVRPDLALGSRQAVLDAVNASQQGLPASVLLGDEDEDDEDEDEARAAELGGGGSGGADAHANGNYSLLNGKFLHAVNVDDDDDDADLGMETGMDWASYDGASGVASLDTARARAEREMEAELMGETYQDWCRKAADEDLQRLQQSLQANGLAVEGEGGAQRDGAGAGAGAGADAGGASDASDEVSRVGEGGVLAVAGLFAISLHR
ncbi:hypothetical protein KEM52_001375 [Ascosphaera acerosa]|nr:hypothetical protein KEM52_001375 [Ascosphaera acerosa]